MGPSMVMEGDSAVAGFDVCVLCGHRSTHVDDARVTLTLRPDGAVTARLQSIPRLMAFTGTCAVPAVVSGFQSWSIALGAAALGITLARGVAAPRSSLLVATTWHRDRARQSVALTF